MVLYSFIKATTKNIWGKKLSDIFSAYKDCGSSDDDGDDSKMNKSENSISSNSCSGSDDEDVDVDFFGLSSKQEVMIQLVCTFK